MIDGLGHDLPPQLWERITGHLIDNLARASTRERIAA